MTVTENEYCCVMGKTKPLHENDEHVSEVDAHDFRFFLGCYGKSKVAIVQMPKGNNKESQETLPKLQDMIKAKYFIVVGMCYGMDKTKTELGDVLVSNKIHIITNEYIEKGKTIHNDDIYSVPSAIWSAFKPSPGFSMQRYNNDPADFVNVKPAEIISNAAVIKSEDYKQGLLNQYPEALGGEMEGSYVVQALALDNRATKPEIIVIKGIADWGDQEKEEFRKWQKFAANAASKYVLYQMEKWSALNHAA